jgi:transcription elongation factor GreA
MNIAYTGSEFKLVTTMNAKKIYLTQKGLEDLKKEYDDLGKTKRPDIVSRLSAAREMGDLSENAEYTAARDELSFIDGRIEELELILKQAVLITDTGQKGTNVVNLGSEVTVKIDGKQAVFTVVGEWEADPEEKKISHESPLGKGLMGKSVGDSIEVEAPVGKMIYTIVSIR